MIPVEHVFKQPFEPVGPTRAELPGIQDPTDTMELMEVDVPSRVQANSRVTVAVDVRNTRCLRANIAHPDYCVIGASSGWRTEVSGALGEETASDGRCHGCASRQTYTLEFTSPPEAGSYALDVEVIAPNTGALIGEETVTVNVRSDAPEDPPTQPPDDGGDGPSIAPGDGDGGGVGAIAPLAALVLLLLLFLGVAVAS